DANLASVLRIEAEIRHAPDLDAVEQDLAGARDPRDRAAEHDVILLGAAAEALHPVDEAEAEHQHAENEGADDEMIGPGFHVLPRNTGSCPRNTASSLENAPLVRGGRAGAFATEIFLDPGVAGIAAQLLGRPCLH